MRVAVKTVIGERATMTPSKTRDLDREISLLMTIRHPNVGCGEIEKEMNRI